jgi:hypothetical protein
VSTKQEVTGQAAPLQRPFNGVLVMGLERGLLQLLAATGTGARCARSTII